MEEWTRWEPIKNLSGKYYVDAIILSDAGLIIQLSENAKKIELNFRYAADSYKYTNESFCFKIFGDLSDRYGGDFYGNWSFFKITDSDYLKWISDKSCTVSDRFPFQHYCIIGGDEVVDILSQSEPKVTIIA